MRIRIIILLALLTCTNWQGHTSEPIMSGESLMHKTELSRGTERNFLNGLELKKDSLRSNSLKEFNEKVEKGDSLMVLGKVLLNQSNTKKDYTYIKGLFENALKIFTELEDKNKQADALNQIAECDLNQGKLIAADQNLQKALLILNTTGDQHIHDTYHLLLLLYNIRGQMEKSLFYALENVKAMEQTKDTSDAGMYYHFVGESYSALGDHKKSLEWYDKALKIRNTFESELLYHIISVTNKELLLLNKNQQALDLVLEVAPFEESSGIADIEEAKGYTYSALGNQGLANKHFSQMLRLYDKASKSHDITRKKSLAYLKLGSYYVKQQEYEKAKGYLLNSFQMASVPNKTKANLMLFKADSAMADFGNAIRYYQEYKRLNDSVFNAEKSRQIQELRIQYETVKNENKIRDLQNENLVKNMELSRANMTKRLIFGGLVLFLTSSILLYNGRQKKKRINKVLVSQKEEIAQKNDSLQELLSEKEWLIKEVHHRVKNNLQIVMSLLNTQSKYVKSPEIYSAIRKSQSRLFAISLIHQRLYKSDNSNLVDLNSYIKNLVHYLQESFDEDSRIRYELDVDRIMLQEDQAVPVGLIINEAVTNAIKYAFPNQQAGIIKVRMKSKKDYYVLSIQDNGIGMKENYFKKVSPSMGMTLIKGLSKQLNGSLKIDHHNGTFIQVQFKQLTISDIYSQNT